MEYVIGAVLLLKDSDVDLFAGTKSKESLRGWLLDFCKRHNDNCLSDLNRFLYLFCLYIFHCFELVLAVFTTVPIFLGGRIVSVV